MLAKRRVEKYGHERLSQLAKDSAELKRQKYGATWPEKVRRGMKLVPLDEQEQELVPAPVTLVRQPCEVCGVEKVLAHHDDYDKPFDVKWLCPKHHVARHKELGWGCAGRGNTANNNSRKKNTAYARVYRAVKAGQVPPSSEGE